MMPEQCLRKSIELMERNILEICKLCLERKLCIVSGKTTKQSKRKLQRRICTFIQFHKYTSRYVSNYTDTST